MKKRAKIVDQSKLCADLQPIVEKNRKVGRGAGIANNPIQEPVPTLEKAMVENILAGDNNNFVILGRDRPSHPLSGTGAKGATGAGRIDLIVGIGSTFRHKDGTFGPPCKETIVNPNFAMDASRVYISQKAEIDRYMGIANTGHIGETTKSSAIGLKSDAIRIHARRDIKIVTGRARIEGSGPDGERLSNGGANEVPGTISFIATNYVDPEPFSSVNMLEVAKGPRRMIRKLQPLVKGDNLEDCLRDMFHLIKGLAKMMEKHGWSINNINTANTAHVHVLGAPIPLPVTPSPSYAPIGTLVGSQDVAHKPVEQNFLKRVDNMEFNYLGKDTGLNSQPNTNLHILSKYVFTT